MSAGWEDWIYIFNVFKCVYDIQGVGWSNFDYDAVHAWFENRPMGHPGDISVMKGATFQLFILLSRL